MTTELIGGPDGPSGDPARADEPAIADFARIGPYRVVQQLGEGGMGVVHLALDQRGRAVALKVLRPHVADDEDARARLSREVATLSRVRSERVAPVFDADLDAPQPYIVTRYVPGPSLDAYVREHGPLEPAQLLRLGRGLAEAVRAIHEAGVVHRDLKPGNVLLVDGDPVLIDFGIAHDADASRMTLTGLVMGTPGYLSPEIIEGADVGAATDWWGWAATLVFAASGHSPFGRGGMEAVLARVCRGDVDLSGVDERLAPLLYAALSPDAARRPDADEVLAALERYAAGRPVTEVLPVRARALPEHAATTVLPVSPPTRPVQQPAAPQPAVTPSRVPSPVPRSETPPARWSPGPPAQSWTGPPGRPLAPQPGSPSGSTAWPGTLPGDREGDPRIALPRRTGVLVAGLAALVGGAAVAPLVTALVALVWSVLARTVDRSVTGTVMRRHANGRRRSDTPVAVAMAPVHLLGALLATLLAAILPVLVGAAALVGTALVLGQVHGTGAVEPTAPAPLAVGALVAVLTAWWGPAGASLRRGSRSLVRSVTGPAPVRAALTVGLWVLAIGLLLATLVLGVDVQWWPLTEAPASQIPTLPTR